MYTISYFIFEFGVIALFFLILRRERTNRDFEENLILAFVFGMILEMFNSSLSKTYYYSRDFLFQISNIPIAIGAGWVFVYYITKKIADRIGAFKWYEAPFFMALIALLIDLVLDPIAIRQGFWVWRIPMDQELLGVPYDNFIGWMAAIWTFALIINSRDRNMFNRKISRFVKYILISIAPVILSLQITAYLVVSALLSGKYSLSEIAKFYSREDYSYAYEPEVQIWKAYLFFFAVLIVIIFTLKNIFLKRAIH